MYNDIVASLYDDAILMAGSLVIKREDLAEAGETYDSLVNFERFLSISQGTDYFYSYETFDIDILNDVLPEELVPLAIQSRENIPVEYREAILIKHRERYHTNYEEKNNYYRSLYGLPDVNDTDFIYINDIPGIDPDTPIHLFTVMEISTLTALGVIDGIIKKYPGKTYLGFLGVKRIDFVRARKAKNFEILFMIDPSNAEAKRLFLREYYMSRRYHLSMYHKEAVNPSESYDGVIGLMILVSAIRNLISVNQLFLINETLLNNILKSYGLYDRFVKLPFRQKRRLVAELDTLLSYAGSDLVLVDISNIFGYNTTINRYYILKRHNMENGEPIFPKLPNGDIDYDAMYRLDFLKTNIKEDKITISDDKLIDFEEVINRDPLWHVPMTKTSEDTVAVSDLKREDFNLVMGKYVSVESAYDISKLVYEIAYFMNLLLDSRNNISLLSTSNMYSNSGVSNVFTFLVFMFAAMSKRNGYDGNIPYSTTGILQILKFNLTDVSALLNDIIKEHEIDLKLDDVLLDKLNAPVYNIERLTEVYRNNTEIYDLILERMMKTQDIKEYKGLLALKKVLFTSHTLRENFKKLDGTYAETYIEMLRDLDPSLAVRIYNTEDEALEDMIQYILEKLQVIFDEAELEFLFLNTPEMQERVMKAYFIEMVNLFIGSTTNLDTFDIVYTLSGPENMHRIISRAIPEMEMYTHNKVSVIDKVYTAKTVVIEERIGVRDYRTLL
jgi:hypothetical protein